MYGRPSKSRPFTQSLLFQTTKKVNFATLEPELAMLKPKRSFLPADDLAEAVVEDAKLGVLLCMEDRLNPDLLLNPDCFDTEFEVL